MSENTRAGSCGSDTRECVLCAGLDPVVVCSFNGAVARSDGADSAIGVIQKKIQNVDVIQIKIVKSKEIIILSYLLFLERYIPNEEKNPNTYPIV